MTSPALTSDPVFVSRGSAESTRTTGQRIRAFRLANQWTVGTFALLLQVSPHTVTGWEREACLPSPRSATELGKLGFQLLRREVGQPGNPSVGGLARRRAEIRKALRTAPEVQIRAVEAALGIGGGR